MRRRPGCHWHCKGPAGGARAHAIQSRRTTAALVALRQAAEIRLRDLIAGHIAARASTPEREALLAEKSRVKTAEWRYLSGGFSHLHREAERTLRSIEEQRFTEGPKT